MTCWAIGFELLEIGATVPNSSRYRRAIKFVRFWNQLSGPGGAISESSKCLSRSQSRVARLCRCARAGGPRLPLCLTEEVCESARTGCDREPSVLDYRKTYVPMHRSGFIVSSNFNDLGACVSKHQPSISWMILTAYYFAGSFVFSRFSLRYSRQICNEVRLPGLAPVIRKGLFHMV